MKKTRRVQEVNSSTKAIIERYLQSKGIAYQAKAKKAELQNIVTKYEKKAYIGVRSGKYYFGTSANTHAGNVARLIAMQEVHSTKDIREKYTKKYAFRETLHRLADEGIIIFTNSSHTEFELTAYGKDLASREIDAIG